MFNTVLCVCCFFVFWEQWSHLSLSKLHISGCFQHNFIDILKSDSWKWMNECGPSRTHLTGIVPILWKSSNASLYISKKNYLNLPPCISLCPACLLPDHPSKVWECPKQGHVTEFLGGEQEIGCGHIGKLVWRTTPIFPKNFKSLTF